MGGAVVILLVVAANITAAALLLLWGANDARAVDLGVVFALCGTAFVVAPLRAWSLASEGSVAVLGGALAGLRVDALLPCFTWRFAGGFPHVAGRDPLAPTVRAGAMVACVVGAALAALPILESVPGVALSPPLARGLRFAPGSLYWVIVGALTLPPLALLPLRYRHASQPERRRVRLLLSGAALGGSPVLLFVVLQALGALADPVWIGRSAWLVYGGLTTVPLLTAYAVVVERALDVRLIVRRAIQYALAKYSLVGLASVPFVALVAFVYRNRALPVSSLFVGPEALTLAAVSVSALVGLRVRDRLAASIDRRFFRERYDARRVLGALIGEVRLATDPHDVARVLAREVGRALHPRRISLLLPSDGDGWLRAVDGAMNPVSVEGPLVTQARRTGSPVAPNDATRQSSRHESEWVRSNGVHLVVPLVGSVGELVGVIALGERRSELPYTGEDRALLGAVASTAAISLEATRARRAVPSVHAETASDMLALECKACGCVQGDREPRCRVCGGEVESCALPAVVAGKFHLMRRLGAGGQGVVFLAEDRSLGRSVALKTLPRASPGQARRLEREARVLAGLSHPNLALVLGLERMGEIPVLVLEYMRLGTLADAIEQGPLVWERALQLAERLCGALTYMHRLGMLHLDIKPSNIGFVEPDGPKILDFGLARVHEAVWGGPPHGSLEPLPSGLTVSGPLRGTLPYMSPEAVRGQPASAHDDLWSLSAVVWEALFGRRPFAARTDAALIARILEGAPPVDAAERDRHPPALVGVLERALSPDRLDRPRDAAELADLLQGVRH